MKYACGKPEWTVLEPCPLNTGTLVVFGYPV